jgi:Fur family ferric uptake transcriptional regulator
MTRQRRVILEQLRKVVSHPTADEVYAMVRRRLPRISLGTVYRNLEILAEGGAIRRLDMAGRQRRYDGNLEHHYHVRCVRCGRVGDVVSRPLPELDNAFRGSSDYEIIGHRLELVGLCPRCKETRRVENAAAHATDGRS